MVSISCCWPPIHAGQRLVSTKVNLTAQNWISAFSAWLVTGACWMPSCTSWLVLVVLPVIMAISFSVLACRAAWNTSLDQVEVEVAVVAQVQQQLTHHLGRSGWRRRIFLLLNLF